MKNQNWASILPPHASALVEDGFTGSVLRRGYQTDVLADQMGHRGEADWQHVTEGGAMSAISASTHKLQYVRWDIWTLSL